MAALPLRGNALHSTEIEYEGKFRLALGRIQQIDLMSRIDIFTQPDVWKPKLCHLLFLVSKVSIAAFYIWLVTLINPSFIIIIILIAKISSELDVVGIKWKTTQGLFQPQMRKKN